MEEKKHKHLAPALLTISSLLLFSVILIQVYKSRRQPDPPPNGEEVPQLSEADLRHIAALANRGTGSLENLELLDAERDFRELVQVLPEEPAVLRNLAITYYLGFDQDDFAAPDVEAAIAELRRIEPEDPLSWWLEAKVDLKLAGQQPDLNEVNEYVRQAVSALQSAIERDPDNVVFYFELFEASKNSEVAELRDAGTQALGEAYRLSPDNLFVLSEWLLSLAERQHEELVNVLEQSKATIAPMRDRILNVTQADIFDHVDRAVAAARDGNWDAALLSTRIVFVNLIRPQDFAQSDKRRLLPHPLEFIAFRFSEPIASQLAGITQTASPFAEQQFAEADEAVTLPAWAVAVNMADFNLDATIDLVVLAQGKLVVLSMQDGSWSPLLETDVMENGRGLLVADLDHDRDHQLAASGQNPACFDADVDVVVYGSDGLSVFRNEKDPASAARELIRVEQPDLPSYRDIQAAVLVDFDHDSDLDLVLATAEGIKPLLNEGQMRFVDVSQFSQLPATDLSFTSLAIVDWDRDVDVDVIAAAADGATIGYLENLRHGNFRWVELTEGFESLRNSREVTVIESDGNVSWDLCGTGRAGTHLVQTRTQPAGSVSALASGQLGTTEHQSILAGDFDNNGAQDILVWGDSPPECFRGATDGTFSPAGEDWIVSGPPQVTACDAGDLDQDGDLDLALVSEGEVRLFMNNAAPNRHWLQVRALGQVDNKGKANHNGIGSLLEIRTVDHYQAQIVQRPVTHFGLGSASKADVLRFLWTNGVPQAVVEPDANQAVCELMILKGSCPYLYTWDGEKYAFVTDLLWASPIGLQMAEHQLAPAREWEYLLVTGEQLKPRDNRYSIVITEELWEAAYFDQVQLLAIDHPAEIDIYSNEKVGPASIAGFQVHTVQRPRVPVAARDPRGNDVLDQVRTRDGQFYRGFTKQIVPGLVDEHYLELDLGELDDPENIRLFLTGWIYPTDTSLNISLSQDPTLSAPRPPSLWVPDTEGQWQQVMPYMGFPGGKTKTICVDLSDAFLTHDYRLRVVTSNEIYWDEAFFTIDETSAEYLAHNLELAAADLRFRGVSEAEPDRPNAPETYDYQRVLPYSKWPPMQGQFTRYGDVRELLIETDARHVVLGAGDEMELSFALPDSPVPEGWRRDFLLKNVGWDKDADLNTIYGQTVEPLPFVGMDSYPYVEGAFPTSEQHRSYLREYQTRTQPEASFWRWVRTQ